MKYILIGYLLWPLMLFHSLKMTLRHKSPRFLLQRMGFAYPRFRQSPLWMHCASVGEVNTALPLLKLLADKYPATPLLVTTTTPTGALTLEKHQLKNVTHSYLPVDTLGTVNLFLHLTRPRLALIMETEIWPLLYKTCARHNIPISIINARLSHRTTNAGNWVKSLYREALQSVQHVLARSDTDRDRYIDLGADATSCETIGNLKFAGKLEVGTLTPLNNFTTRPYILAASTHDDEEWQLAKLWVERDFKTLLVIAPRHPERGRSIVRQMKNLNFHIPLRSKHQPITEDTRIYIADTLGELSLLIRHADLVFMGGSLISHGGQNLLEPARLGKPILIGPHSHNFETEVDLLLQHKACVQVEDVEQLGDEITRLLAQPEQATELAQNAQQLMTQQQGIAERYLEKLVEYYDPILTE